MNLFRRLRGLTAGDAPPPPPPNVSPRDRSISLSDDQKVTLAAPVDPRVDRIMQEVNASRGGAPLPDDDDRIIGFPIPKRKPRVDDDPDLLSGSL